MRLQSFHVLGKERRLDPQHQPLVCHVDAFDLHPDRVAVEKVAALLLGVVADRLVGVDESGGRVEPIVPAARLVARDRERTLGERLRVVVQLVQVDVVHRTHALAARAHAADDRERPLQRLGIALLDDYLTGPAGRSDVERERLGRADVGLAQPAEKDAEHRVDVGRRADRRTGVGAHPFLVDDDRRRQPIENVNLRPGKRRHEALHEGAVGLVDEPLRLGGDRCEDERALPRAGDAGEHRKPALRDHEADVLEVVHTRAVHADQIVAVGNVLRRRLRVCHSRFAPVLRSSPPVRPSPLPELHARGPATRSRWRRCPRSRPGTRRQRAAPASRRASRLLR